MALRAEPRDTGNLTFRLLLSVVTIALTLSRPASANGSAELAAFVQVPAAIYSCPLTERQGIPAASLPRALTDLLWRDYYQPYGAMIFPAAVPGLALDLNGDAIFEYLLQTPVGGTGGPHYVVFAEREEGWETILTFQGWPCLLSPLGGWHPIVAIFRGGPETYRKTRFEFADGRYHCVSAESFDGGEVRRATACPDRTAR